MMSDEKPPYCVTADSGEGILLASGSSDGGTRVNEESRFEGRRERAAKATHRRQPGDRCDQGPARGLSVAARALRRSTEWDRGLDAVPRRPSAVVRALDPLEHRTARLAQVRPVSVRLPDDGRFARGDLPVDLRPDGAAARIGDRRAARGAQPPDQPPRGAGGDEDAPTRGRPVYAHGTSRERRPRTPPHAPAARRQRHRAGSARADRGRDGGEAQSDAGRLTATPSSEYSVPSTWIGIRAPRRPRQSLYLNSTRPYSVQVLRTWYGRVACLIEMRRRLLGRSMPISIRYTEYSLLGVAVHEVFLANDLRTYGSIPPFL